MQWHKKESFTNPKGNLPSLLAAAELAFLNLYQEAFHKPKKPMHKKILSQFKAS